MSVEGGGTTVAWAAGDQKHIGKKNKLETNQEMHMEKERETVGHSGHSIEGKTSKSDSLENSMKDRKSKRGEIKNRIDRMRFDSTTQ